MNTNRVWLRSKAYRQSYHYPSGLLPPGITGHKIPGSLPAVKLCIPIVHAKTYHDDGARPWANSEGSDRGDVKRTRVQVRRRLDLAQPEETGNVHYRTPPEILENLPKWKQILTKKKERKWREELRAKGLPLPPPTPEDLEKEEKRKWRRKLKEEENHASEMLRKEYGSDFNRPWERPLISGEHSALPTQANLGLVLNDKEQRTWIDSKHSVDFDVEETPSSINEDVGQRDYRYLNGTQAFSPPGKTMFFPWLNASYTYHAKYKKVLTEQLRCACIETRAYTPSTFVEGLEIMKLWHQSKTNDDAISKTIEKLITSEERALILKDHASRLVQSGIYCHIMSNGGALAFLAYAVKWKVITGQMLPVFSMFIDSAPGWTDKTMEFLPSFGISEDTIKNWIPIIQWIPEALNDPELVNIKAVRHYAYSEADVVVNAVDVFEHSKRAIDVGYRVARWNVLSAPHVGILKEFSTIYSKTVGLLWKKGIVTNPQETDWTRIHMQWQWEESQIIKRIARAKSTRLEEEKRAEAEARGEEYVPPKVKKPKVKPIKPPRIWSYEAYVPDEGSGVQLSWKSSYPRKEEKEDLGHKEELKDPIAWKPSHPKGDRVRP